MSDWSPFHTSRRAVLATGAVTIASVAGCSASSSESATLDLTLYNHVDSPYTVEMSLYEVNDDQSRSDARAYSERIDVEPEGETRREDVTEIQQYLVRYEVYENNRNLTDEDHIHYYPANGGSDDGIALDIHPPGMMTRR